MSVYSRVGFGAIGALAAVVIVAGPSAAAGWTHRAAAAERVSTAHFVYPGAAGLPPAPEVVQDETALVLSWTASAVSGEVARSPLSYEVLAVDADGASAAALCTVVRPSALEVTCAGEGLTPAYLAEHRFTERPVYRGWAGASSALSLAAG